MPPNARYISHNDGVKNNRRTAIDIYSANPNASHCLIYNITIYNQNGAAVGFGGLPMPEVVLRNNIFICSGDVVAGDNRRGRFENNVYWSVNKQKLLFDGHDSLHEWAAATGQETVSGRVVGRTVNPRLINANAKLPTDPMRLGDMAAFKLRADSPYLHAGISISDNGGRDFWGNAVPKLRRPAVGAFNPQ